MKIQKVAVKLFVSCLLISNAVKAQDQTLQDKLERLFGAIGSAVVQSKDELTAEELRTLYRATIEHPVASLDKVDKYENTKGEIGYCFGRAMTAERLARLMGAKEGSIRKIFILGDMRSSPSVTQAEWYFHVSTIVKGPGGKWFTIDPIMHDARDKFNPLHLDAWIEEMRTTYDRWHGDKSPRTKLYIVPAEAVLPDIRDFQTPGDGSRIIHTTFDPKSKGLKVSKDFSAEGKAEVFELSLEEAQTHFIGTDEPKAEDRFNFTRLKVNESEFSFKGYFEDLLNELKSRVKKITQSFLMNQDLNLKKASVKKSACARKFKNILKGAS